LVVVEMMASPMLAAGEVGTWDWQKRQKQQMMMSEDGRGASCCLPPAVGALREIAVA
jgi:hypothetical protein